MKHKKLFLSAILIITFYFLIRTYNLNLQPVFCDEAIYIHWAQKIIQNPKINFFIPLVDGKTPLFIWLVVPSLKIISDPLLAGRIVSALISLLTLYGAYYLSKRHFQPKAALIAILFFTFTPFLVFFDRMALTDSMLAAFSFWSLILALKIVEKPSAKNITLLGLSLGASILTKTPGMFNFFLLPLALIKADFKNKKKLTKSILGLTLSAIIGLCLYNSLRISPYFKQLGKRNEYYHFPISRLWEKPLDPFIGNVKEGFAFLTKLMTWPVFLSFIFAIFLSLYKKKKENIIIFLWGTIPFIILTALLKTYTARYILPSVVPFVFLASWSFAEISEKIAKNTKAVFGTLTTLVLIPAIIFDYQLITKPWKANLPEKEKNGYFEGWTAGYGIKEMANFLKEKAKDQKILVVTAGAFGTLPDGFEIYIGKNKNIEVWYSSSQIESYVYEKAKEKPVYFVIHKSNLVQNPNLNLIKEIPKPPWKETPTDSLLLYQIIN